MILVAAYLASRPSAISISTCVLSPLDTDALSRQKPPMLTIDTITCRIAGRLLIESASLSVPDGAKLGIVGKNGAGKSTLFKVLTGDLAMESGSVHLPKRAKIGQVAQEAPGGSQSLLDFVLEADTERAALLAEAETAQDAERIADIHTRLADIDAYSAEARAGAILSGLGFDADAQKRPCSDFSGGWRMRVALAAVLFSEPDLLLLDEPTNYLDLEGTLWLQSYLRKYPHTILIISHDRELLNATTDMIAHLEHKRLTLYKGNYDSFERQRREKQELLQKAAVKQDAKRKHMQAFVDRFRYKASKARQAQSRLKALERMGDTSLLLDETSLPISFPSPEKTLAPPIIRMEDVAVGYEPGKPVLSKLNLRIDDDDRIGLLGKNGNGKSTFAKLLAERLAPMGGDVTKASKLRVAYFAQHQLDELKPAQSAYDHVRPLMAEAHESKVRARVAQMGLGAEKMDTKVAELSGGEKARLLLGLATFHGPHLLILDEPTNHLDMDSRQALVEALNDFPGAVIIVSHDRALLDASVERLWLVANGGVAPFDGDLDDYQKYVLTGAMPIKEPADPVPESNAKPASAPSGNAQERRKQAAEKRAALAPLRKKIKALEAEMAKLNQAIQRADAELADGSLFTDKPDQAAKISKSRADAERQLVEQEETWLYLSEELEASMTDA